MTKTLTGIAIMQLRDLRKLELDDPVVDYVPELHQVHNPFGDIREITIRHVMSHSAGFRASTWPWGGGESWHPHEPTNWDQLVAMFPYTKINFKPGSRFSYSNPGIILLGRIVELLSHEDYETYVDKNILKPLGMHRSYFDLTPRHLLQHRSNNYTVRDGARTANGLDFDTGITVSNSGLNSPFPDMVRYVNFLLGVGEGPSILKRSSLEEMWRVHQPVPNGNVPEGGMGLIFFILRSNDLRVIGHTGSQKAFQAFLWIAPDKKAGALAAFNTVGISTDGQPAQPATRAIMTELQEKVFSQLFRAAF